MTVAVSLIVAFSTVIILIIVAVISMYFTDNTIIKVDKNQIMEFHSSMDLCDLPIVTFYQGKNKYNFLVDTGSNVCYINNKSAIEVTKIENAKDSFVGASGESADCELGNITIYHRDQMYEHIVRIADLSQAFESIKSSVGITLTGIIGNDFMQKYKYCIDFKEFIVYRRK